QERVADEVAAYTDALERFERARDAAGCSAVHTRLANAYAKLGAHRQAWQHRVAGLALLSYEERARQSNAISAAALDSRAPGYLHAALDLHGEAIRSADASPLDQAYGLLFRAFTEREIGRREDSLCDAAEARNLLPRITDPAIAASMSASVSFALGDLLRERR